MSDTPSITCPKCSMTSYNPNDIAWGYCGNCHEYTQDGAIEHDTVKMDPRFLERPQSVDFWRMVGAVKQIDRQSDIYRAHNHGEPVLVTEDVDPTSIAYMSQQRVIRARQLLPEDPDGNTTGREAAIWADGFIIGKRYAESLAAGEVANGVAEDGNRRARRTRK